jgi:hypothetical protein
VERFGVSSWRRLLLLGTCCASLFIACHIIDRLCYQCDPAWNEFLEYNRLRARIHDTPLKNSLAQVAEKVGWSQNDAWMFNQDYFADPEVFGSVTKLRSLVGELQKVANPIPSSEFLSLSNLLLPTIWGADAGLLLKFALLNAFALLLFAGHQRTRWLATLVLLYGLFVVITVVLRNTARLPQRVSYNMPVFLHAICLYWLTDIQPPRVPESIFEFFKRMSLALGFNRPLGLPVHAWFGRPAFRLALVLPLCALWVFFYGSCLRDWGRAAWYTNAGANYLKAEIDPKLFALLRRSLPAGQKSILVPVFWDAPLEQCLLFHPSIAQMPFSLLPYSWLPHSPLYVQALERHNLRPYAVSLVDRPNVFFLMTSGWPVALETFYREHYGLRVRFDQVIDTDQMPQYRDCRLYLYQAHAVAHVAFQN